MSSSSTYADAAVIAPAARPVLRRSYGRLLRSELRLVFGRRRNLALLVVLAAVPVLIGVAIDLSSGSPQPGEGPPFIDRISGNGLFLTFTGLIAVLPLFLPLAVGVVSGDAVAGEAGLGTLRYLLVVPVGRTRLLLVKYAAAVTYCCAATLLVAAAGLLTGLALFPVGDVTLLSGEDISMPAALGRAVLVAFYVAASLAGLAAIGIFVSTLTEVPVGAMAATVIVAISSEILDSIPQVAAIHPYLLSHYWLAFGDLLRTPIPLENLTRGLLQQAAYIGVFLPLAWSRFTTKDVSG